MDGNERFPSATEDIMVKRLEFDGDVIVVTGAGGGMGRAHALELAGRGARVVVNDLGGSPFGGGADPQLAESVAEEIRAFGGEAVANTQSVGTEEGGASLTDTAMKEWGRVDAVVSNAGISVDNAFEDMSTAEFDLLLDVKLRGARFVIQPAYKVMKAAGRGRIVAITSMAGLLGTHRKTNYAAANAGLIGLIRTIALEGAPHGIKANLLNPGSLGTRMTAALIEGTADQPKSFDDLVLPPHVVDKLTPERVSPMVTVLVHESCPCTSQILNAYAGIYGRATITMNRGWVSEDDATAEDLVANWDEITDQSTAEDPVPDSHLYSVTTFQRVFGAERSEARS
jgi:NAD(P)-dependent dehydrogenase (short-subunit alcohol dehydrogenase family)